MVLTLLLPQTLLPSGQCFLNPEPEDSGHFGVRIPLQSLPFLGVRKTGEMGPMGSAPPSRCREMLRTLPLFAHCCIAWTKKMCCKKPMTDHVYLLLNEWLGFLW